MMEAETLRPDSDHAPAVEKDDSHRHGVEHGFGGEAVAFLDLPERKDSNGLGDDADD
jgi:hypothetical protein